jgi:hypothetical protein
MRGGMGMRVSFATEPAPGVVNEDYVFAVPGLVGVLDGVTAPPELETGCIHGIPWYVRRLAARILEGHANEPTGDLRELVAAAIDAVRSDHGGACDLAHLGTPSSTVCMLRVDEHVADWLVLSDSPLVLDRNGTIDAITDHRLERISAPDGQGGAPIGSAEHQARRLARIQAQRHYRNQPDGYWLAAATPDAARHALTGVAPLTGMDRLTRAAVLTDGASRAVEVFGLYGWSELLQRAEEHGPAALIADVRTAEHADASGQDYPRSKAHDDATALLVHL